MTRTSTCGELRRELGVYVLGAMAPADRGAIESHLAYCAGCRSQLAELAGLPGLLHRVAADDLGVLVPAVGANRGGPSSAQPLGALLAQAARRRKYRACLQLGAAAAIGLAIGASIAYGALHAPPQPLAAATLPGAMTVRGHNPRDHATAVVRFAGQRWGVQLYVQVNGVAPGTRCVLEVTDSRGQESAAASWTVAAGDESAWYGASSSVPVADVRGFVVTAGTRPLVRVSVPTRKEGRG